jgi:hypothetical protein
MSNFTIGTVFTYKGGTSFETVQTVSNSDNTQTMYSLYI